MQPVLTAAQMQAIDTHTIDTLGIPGAVLMETAGRAVATQVRCMLNDGSERVTVLCGVGNNGGDGFVAGRVLREAGLNLRLYLVGRIDDLQGDARLHAMVFQNCGGSILLLASEASVQELASEGLEGVVVDALFGIGLHRPLQPMLQELVFLINKSSARVLSVDLPSGMRADDGAPLGDCVVADQTLAIAALKVAHAGAPGFVNCGSVTLAEIGIPRELATRACAVGVLEPCDLLEALPTLQSNSHKTERGHVLVIAGSAGTYGAGRLAALAALRSGAGLVTLAAHPSDPRAQDPLMTADLDAMAIADLCIGKSAIVIGPGMSTSAAGKQEVLDLLTVASIPLLVDADGLNHIGQQLERIKSYQGPIVLSPHPGEAARLLGVSTATVQADRLHAVRELAQKSQAVVILKGARTCICDGRDPKGFVFLNPTGGPELSTAGTGDVLAGMVGALLAQGRDALDAAKLAVYWHGVCGQVTLEALGGSGVIASDLLLQIPQSLTQILASLSK